VHAEEQVPWLSASDWQAGPALSVLTPNGRREVPSFVKQIGEAKAQIAFFAEENILFANSAAPAGFPKFLTLYDQSIHSLGWTIPSKFRFSGFSRKVSTASEIEVGLREFEEIFRRDPRELVYVKLYKGAFEPFDSGARELKEVVYNGENIILKFLDGGQESTLELGPGFKYIRSTIENGKSVFRIFSVI
jgi:hypothetical protein